MRDLRALLAAGIMLAGSVFGAGVASADIGDDLHPARGRDVPSIARDWETVVCRTTDHFTGDPSADLVILRGLEGEIDDWAGHEISSNEIIAVVIYAMNESCPRNLPRLLATSS